MFLLKIEFFVTDYNPYWFPQTILTADNLCFLLLYFICYILVSVYSKAVKANQLLLSQTLLISVYKWVGVLIIVHSMSTVKTREKLICSEPMSVIGDQGDCRWVFFLSFFKWSDCKYYQYLTLEFFLFQLLYISTPLDIFDKFSYYLLYRLRLFSASRQLLVVCNQ